jgi:hypothetical protein
MITWDRVLGNGRSLVLDWNLFIISAIDTNGADAGVFGVSRT